jgi:site-specific recombinase XerD
MLENYFIKPSTIDRIRASWISELIERYVKWLTENHYSARTIVRRVPILMSFGKYAWEQGARMWECLPDYVDPFAEMCFRQRDHNRKDEHAHKKITDEIKNPLKGMIDFVTPGLISGNGRTHKTDPFPSIADFFHYLRKERGLREASIYLYKHHLRSFECYLSRIGLHNLSGLSPVVLSAFLTEHCPGLSSSHCTGLVCSIRVFLRYLFREGVTKRDLSFAVEGPRKYRMSDIPRSIKWDEVGRMLEAVDRRTTYGKRDYAILLLLVTYGLRGREVADLTLDSIDWKKEQLFVPGRKAGHSTVYPLSTVVGEAVLDYLHTRPQTTDRHIFFRFLAPLRPYTYNAISSRVAHYLHKAGISVHRAGSHTLRHTCVQHLVDAHFSFKTIGDYVGHRSVDSTAVYTKINVEALREVALGDGEEVL